MNLLVCGGAGFIGSTFVKRRLATSRDRVVVLDKLTYAGNLSNLTGLDGKGFRFVQGDIADASIVTELLIDADVDGVVNFAAESHVDRSILDAEAFLRTGVIGVHVLLEAARVVMQRRRERGAQPPRFLQVSTDEVYGSVPVGYSTESDPLAPASPYSAAKAAGDLLVLAYHRTYGLDSVVTRGANTYGPYQHPEKVVPLFITNALQRLPLPLYGDGLQRRDWLHVRDHADAIATVLDRGESGGVYNIPGSGERTNLDLTSAILDLVGAPASLVRPVEDRPGHDRRYSMDGSRLAELGAREQVTFEQGLRETVRWYRENEAWWRPLLDKDWAVYYEQQYGKRLAGSIDA